MPAALQNPMTGAPAEFESECIRRILAGERHLFHELIRPCERSIYLLLLSILKNEAEAEDAAQETAIKTFLNLHTYRGESKFRTCEAELASPTLIPALDAFVEACKAATFGSL